MSAVFFFVVPDYNMVLLALSYNTGGDGAYHERKFHCILSDVCFKGNAVSKGQNLLYSQLVDIVNGLWRFAHF